MRQGWTGDATPANQCARAPQPIPSLQVRSWDTHLDGVTDAPAHAPCRPQGVLRPRTPTFTGRDTT